MIRTQGLGKGWVAVGGLALAFAAGVALADGGTGGDPKRGAEVFRVQCSVCHSADPARPSPIGPLLYGVVGRPAGTLAGFKYSDAMKKVGLAWTPANLDKYLENPWNIAPGTPMALVVPSEKNRADVIAYLTAQSAAKP
jgi:cytochrome c